LCGGLLAAGGAAGGLRVWETRGWAWESRPSLGHGAPCVAGAWQGPLALSEGPRTLLLALQGSPALHVLRFGKQRVLIAGGRGSEAARSEYVGQIDLATLGGSPQLSIASLVTDPQGERLLVAWSVAPSQTTHISVLQTTAASQQVHPVGEMECAEAPLCSLAFASRMGDGVASGSLVSATWPDGHITLTPLYY